MTYCCGILVRDGLVMIADTRTNAGLDNVSTFRKLHIFSKPGERIMAIASAGNLAISQSVLSTLTEGIEDPDTGDVETLMNAPTMFQAAQRIGRAIRLVHATEGPALRSEDVSFDVSFLFGGQIKGSRMRLFMVYTAGNFIECTTDTPYLQIGEHKYGKPVLDRAMHYDVELYEALKTGLISMDSTMRSNLGVGLPIDVLVVRTDACEADLNHRIEAGEPYFHDLRSRWSAALRRRTRIFRDHPINPKQKQKTEGEETMADATNKIAIVTGAGTGVGRAASLALMNAGFTVVLAGRRMEMLEETKKLGDNVGKSLCVSADMTDPGSIAALFAKVMDTYGRLDVLFNNAGMGAPPVNFEDLSLEQWQAVVNTNLTGPFLCTQHAFRIMKDQNPRGGRIINNGSISAHAPRPYSAAYTSTKHAITGLTKASNLDGRKYDIAVGQVDIGNAATPMTDRMVAGPGVMQPDGTMKHEPRMDAKAVGDAVAYMAGLPLDANVLFMTVMASKMPFVGRG